MTTATEVFNNGQGGDLNFSASTGGMDLGGSGPLLQSSLPMEGGMAFDAGASSAMAGTTTTTTTTQHFTSTTGEVGLPPTGTVMGVGGGVGDNNQIKDSLLEQVELAKQPLLLPLQLHIMELVLAEKEVYYSE